MTEQEKYMKAALKLAQKAADEGEVPVGAVVVCDGKIVGRGRNRRETKKNALHHAEIEAIEKACKKLGGWRLHRCDLYVTLEPCPMCAGALINSRMKTVYYGAPDPKAGSCGSLINLFALPYNHQPALVSGVLEQECADILRNFFRDQLDRNGEVETLILKVKKFLETFEGNVVLNADDPNVARLGLANPNNKNIHYFSVDRYQGATDKPYEVGEGKFCPFCDTELVYDYYQYSHIGKFHCPKCGFGNIEPEVEIKNVDLTVPSFEADGETYKTAHNSIYYMYNMAAVYTAAKLYNFDKAILHDTFEHFEVNNGRLERFEVDGSSLLVNLAKNPVGANMTLRVMNEQAGSKELLFVLNDNLADGHDVSWIWDINFSVFNNVDRVVTSGTRAYDIAIRIKCSGYDPDKIFVYPDLDEATASLFSTKGDKYAIANYTAIQPTRAAIKRYKSLKENGEEK